jgi:hypothetical protein
MTRDTLRFDSPAHMTCCSRYRAPSAIAGLLAAQRLTATTGTCNSLSAQRRPLQCLAHRTQLKLQPGGPIIVRLATTQLAHMALDCTTRTQIFAAPTELPLSSNSIVRASTLCLCRLGRRMHRYTATPVSVIITLLSWCNQDPIKGIRP